MAARNGKNGLLEKVRNIYCIGFLDEMLIIVQRYSGHDTSDYFIVFQRIYLPRRECWCPCGFRWCNVTLLGTKTETSKMDVCYSFSRFSFLKSEVLSKWTYMLMIIQHCIVEKIDSDMHECKHMVHKKWTWSVSMLLSIHVSPLCPFIANYLFIWCQQWSCDAISISKHQF